MTIEKRLIALERTAGLAAGRFVGWIELASGQRPIDALAGASKPGLYFLIDAACNGPGFMGRVYPAGAGIFALMELKMQSLRNRLERLERPPECANGKPLPLVVSDETTDAELAELRRNGREVYRLSEAAAEVFV